MKIFVQACGPWWVLLLLFHAEPADGSDWPTYMRDYTRVGSTPDRLAPPLAEQWVYASPSPPQHAWPGPEGEVIEGLKIEHRVRFDDVFHVAVVGQQVYFGSSVDNSVYSLDAASGSVRWSYVTGGPVRLAPTVVSGRVHVGSDDGVVYCLDAADGHLIWKLLAGPSDERILARGRMTSRWAVRTGILVDHGVAYFGAGVFPDETVYLYAVHADTGQVIWKNDSTSQRDADRNDLSPQGYLLATDDVLFVPSGRTLPAAFDRHTGQLRHKQLGGGKQIGGSQALLADEQLLSLGENDIVALDQSTGDIQNRIRGRRMTFADNRAYIAGGEEIVAIDRSRFAESQAERVAIEEQRAELERKLRRNPAPLQLKRIHQIQAKLEKARAELGQLGAAGNQGTVQYGAAEANLAQLTKELADTAIAYDVSRKVYEKLAAEMRGVEQQLDGVIQNGVLWRSKTPHESALVLTQGSLVVGGVGRVMLLDADSGIELWSQDVEGEVRGLAVADGRLFVSTTSGRIYCFGDQTRTVTGDEQAVASSALAGSAFPEDDLAPLYRAAADQIIERSGIRRGFCLVCGSGEGRLAYELAQRTNLVIYCTESDAEKVAVSRKALAAAGLYGHRVTVQYVPGPADPYSNYFANLIVSDTLLRTGEMPEEPREVARQLKPEGGVMCLGVPAAAPQEIKQKCQEKLATWIAATGLAADLATVEPHEDWTLVRRGPLPGVADWTHQYGNPGNTGCVDDQRVRGAIRVLWYGDPGPSNMLNRHLGAVGPLSARGRLFVQDDESVTAYDAYNGQYLWELKNPGALRTGVFQNRESGNLAASDDRLFVVVEDKCLEADSATGVVKRIHTIPDPQYNHTRQWGYLGFMQGRLFGTSTQRKLLGEEARYRGRTSEAASTDKIFATDAVTGERLWTYQGQHIAHSTIALDDSRLYFIDSSISPEERERLLQEDKAHLNELTGEERQRAEERFKNMDVRRAVALDSATGQVLWAKPVDVTDCSDLGKGGGQIVLMVAGGHVVLCGANANGHYWEQFVAGQFKRRRLVVLSAPTGDLLWARDADYRHRPIVIGGRIIAEPWAFELATGKQEMRTHPLTGQLTPWKFIRPGHHCGAVSATPNMLFFRSGYTAYYDLNTDSGTRHFAGHRLGCWINTIPAGGLVMIPEASAGCACLFSLTATIVFEPQPERTKWGVFSAEGPTMPVQHLALNLGAPGDRRDAQGKLWLSYPRPASRPGLDLPIEIRPMTPFGVVGSYFQHNSDSYPVEGSHTPWIYASGMRGMTRCEIPLVAEGQEAVNYTVRLFFAAPDGDQPGQRVFDVKLQGQTAAEKMDVVAQAGGPRKALVFERSQIPVSRELVIELVPQSRQTTDGQLPVLCAVEVIRSGAQEIVQGNVALR